MNRENRARIRAIRDGLLDMRADLRLFVDAVEVYANELDEMFPSEEPKLGIVIDEETAELLGTRADETNWTTADADTKEGVYLKDLKEMTSLKDVAIVGQIKTVFDLKSYATKEGKKGFVYRLVLQDESDEVVVVAFDDMATKLKAYTIGQYLRITNAWQMKKNKNGKPEVHVGNFAKIEVVE